jgi:hypothetical protein
MGARDHLVTHPGMGTPAPKSGRFPSRQSARLCCIRSETIIPLDVLGGIAVEGDLRLARIRGCLGVESLTNDGVSGNGRVTLNLLLG